MFNPGRITVGARYTGTVIDGEIPEVGDVLCVKFGDLAVEMKAVESKGGNVLVWEVLSVKRTALGSEN